MLLHLVYASFATRGFADNALKNMVARAQCKNEQQGITAVLLHQQGTFLHGIEGEEAQVRSLFALVHADPRHRDVRVLVKTHVSKRAFAGQAMSFHDADLGDLQSAASDAKLFGLTDIYQGFSWGGCVALQILTPYRS